MKDDNCIFCKLANGEIPTMSLYEDEDFNVIFDAGPATLGHALILPKDHYANVYEMPEDLTGKAAILAKKMTIHMTEKLECDGFNILQNNGEVAGQTVFHFHVHIIPRYAGGPKMVAWEPGVTVPEEREEIAEKLKNALS